MDDSSIEDSGSKIPPLKRLKTMLETDCFARELAGRDVLIDGLLYWLEDAKTSVPVACANIVMDATTGRMMLWNVCVACNGRGQGLGDYLLSYVLHQWSLHACFSLTGRQLFLTVIKGNQTAIRLYEKHGFVLIDVVGAFQTMCKTY